MCQKTSRATGWVAGMLLGMTHEVTTISTAHAQSDSTSLNTERRTPNGVCGSEEWAQLWSRHWLRAAVPRIPRPVIRVEREPNRDGSLRVTSTLTSSAPLKKESTVIRPDEVKDCALAVFNAVTGQAQRLTDIERGKAPAYNNYEVDIKATGALAECNDPRLLRQFLNLVGPKEPSPTPTPKQLTVWLTGDLASGVSVEATLTSQDFAECEVGSRFPETGPTTCAIALSNAAIRGAAPADEARKAVCESIVSARNLRVRQDKPWLTSLPRLPISAVKLDVDATWMSQPGKLSRTFKTNSNVPLVRVGLGPIGATNLNLDGRMLGTNLTMLVNMRRRIDALAVLGHFTPGYVWTNSHGVGFKVESLNTVTLGVCGQATSLIGACLGTRIWQILAKGHNVAYPRESMGHAQGVAARLMLEPPFQLPENARIHIYSDFGWTPTPLTITSVGHTMWRAQSLEFGVGFVVMLPQQWPSTK